MIALTSSPLFLAELAMYMCSNICSLFAWNDSLNNERARSKWLLFGVSLLQDLASTTSVHLIVSVVECSLLYGED